MRERHEMLGERAELKPKQLRLRIECEALRDKLRTALPPHEEVDGLSGETILNTAIALQTSLDELAGLNRKITILEQQLGISK
ncbi:MAG: hypothetical protein LBR94_03135 [Desulfovibrio sp.]|jgi:hypothetical protein|nr:hypothetical protein [Desulfovibrio sp.]